MRLICGCGSLDMASHLGSLSVEVTDDRKDAAQQEWIVRGAETGAA